MPDKENHAGSADQASPSAAVKINGDNEIARLRLLMQAFGYKDDELPRERIFFALRVLF